MTRRILFAGLALGPVVIALHYFTNVGDTALFALAAAALIPLAWLIGEATEHAAEHTGPGIGGFLNATFGNAPELIIALIAIHEGLTDVVRGSLTGSVVGNLLLVLGFSLFAGGRGEIERWSSFLAFGMIGLSIGLFLIPSIPSWTGDPDAQRIVDLSIPVAIVAARRSTRSSPSTRCDGTGRCTSRATRRSTPGRSRQALAALGIATVVTALVAEVLVGSLETFAHKVAPLGLLRRSRDRRDRRQRGRARRRGDRRLPRQDQAGRRDRALLVGAGGDVPDPGRGAALVADRPARPRLPQGRDRRARDLARGRDGDDLER